MRTKTIYVVENIMYTAFSLLQNCQAYRKNTFFVRMRSFPRHILHITRRYQMTVGQLMGFVNVRRAAAQPSHPHRCPRFRFFGSYSQQQNYRRCLPNQAARTSAQREQYKHLANPCGRHTQP